MDHFWNSRHVTAEPSYDKVVAICRGYRLIVETGAGQGIFVRQIDWTAESQSEVLRALVLSCCFSIKMQLHVC